MLDECFSGVTAVEAEVNALLYFSWFTGTSLPRPRSDLFSWEVV